MSETKEEKKKYIPAIDPDTRELNYTSVSAIAKFNPAEYGGCMRKWFLRYVMGLKEESTVAQAFGTKSHAQIEHYLESGEDVLGPRIRVGKQLLPNPGSDLLVEWGFDDKKGSREDFLNFEGSLVTAADIPLVGFMDWLNRRGEYVSEAGDILRDPYGTVEVGDNKTSSNLSYVEPGAKLINTTQMPGYGEFVRKKWPDTTHVRLSHVYFQSKRAKEAIKRSVLVPIATIERRWYEAGHETAAKMKEIAQREKPEDVPMNTDACAAYSGCQFRDNCFKSPIRRFKVGLLSKMKQLNADVDAVAAAPVASAPPKVEAPVQAAPAPLQEIKKKSKLVIQDVVNEPELVAAKDAIQGAFYEVNGVTSVFICSTGGKLSFQPTNGGMPILLDSDVAVTKLNAPSAPVVPTVEVKTEVPAPTPAPTPAPAVEVKAEEKPKVKRTRKKAEPKAEVAADTLRLFVNCIPNGGSFSFLDTYVNEVVTTVRSEFDVIDLRCVPDKNSPLCYGGWKGVLAEAVRKNPPELGTYIVVTKGNDFAEVIVEALAPSLSAGSLVRGV